MLEDNTKTVDASAADSPEPAMVDVSYPGSKSGAGVCQWLINLMPAHDLYIEAFLGNGAVLRSKRPATWTIGIDRDRHAIARFRGDEVPNFELVVADALRWLAGAKLPPRTLVYLDPPYLATTRRRHRPIYRCELSTEAEHAALLEVAALLPCYVMISGYDSELYNNRLNGWRRSEFWTMTRGGAALEVVWMNFPEPLELHDYKFLGKDFRDRERIKRKRERWKAKLLRMPAHERHAILSAVSELRDLIAVSDDAILGCRHHSPEVTMLDHRQK